MTAGGTGHDGISSISNSCSIVFVVWVMHCPLGGQHSVCTLERSEWRGGGGIEICAPFLINCHQLIFLLDVLLLGVLL